mmetsp:Transcript_18919/g.44455  ORF Transcript_18919/g.44455 Transcript_18919/m.44455 type:complete len:537 (+) Transcript_18919:3-1613(+)
MSACMDNVSAAEVREACKAGATVAVPFIMQAGNLCRERDSEEGWRQVLFEEAAVLVAKDACKACTGAADCDEQLAEAVGRALGEGRENLAPGEASRFQNLAMTRAVADSVKGCIGARRDNTSATCDDHTSFLWGCGKSRPTDAIRAKTEEARFRVQAAVDAAAWDKGGCLRTKSATEQMACFSTSSAAIRSLIDELVYTAGVSQATLADRVEQLQRKATRLALGDEFTACKRAAASPEGHKACDDQLRLSKVAAGVDGDLEDLLQQYRADVLQEASNCGIADPKECRMKAKGEAKVSGMKEREYGVLRKIGAMREGAEEWAACTEAGGASAICHEFATWQLSTVSGVNVSYVDSKTLAQVENLADALMKGLRVVLIRRKRLQIAVGTNNGTCVSELEDQMVAKCEEAALGNGTKGNSTKRPCRLVEELAEYGAYFAVNLEDSEMVPLSEAVATWLQGKELIEPFSLHLSERPLTLVLQAYASQDLAECAEGDLFCQSDAVGDPPPAPSPPEAVTNFAAGSSLLMAVVLTQLSVVKL